MSLLDRISGVQNVGRVTVAFREDGRHRVNVERVPSAPTPLHGSALDMALFLYYTAKSLHALGGAAQELRQHLALSAVVLRMNKFDPFVSFIDQSGECNGLLQVNRAGGFSINTTYRVPTRETNNFVLDSALLMLTHIVQSQATEIDRGRIAAALEVLEHYYQTDANPGSFKALREAAATAFESYRRPVEQSNP